MNANYHTLSWLLASCIALAIPHRVCQSQAVINSPPEVIPGAFRLYADEILNVGPGGEVGSGFVSYDGSAVNISGGEVGGYFRAFPGSEVNITGGKLHSRFEARADSVINVAGGTLGDQFDAQSGSKVRISGGSFGRYFRNELGSNVELVGGDFRLNNADFSGDDITLGYGDVFTGTLADGSTFVFARSAPDILESVALTRTTLPPTDLTPMVVTTPIAGGPVGLRAGQMLTLQDGGELPSNFAVIDGILSIEGGFLERGAEIAGSTVTISGGDAGDFFYAYSGSEVSITGGKVGFRFEAFESDVNISGGHVGNLFRVHSGSTARISAGEIDSMEASRGAEIEITGGSIGFGGNIYSSFRAEAGSTVQISGGTFARWFRNASGSDVALVGGEFFLNGSEFVDSTITLGDGDVFTGTLADGSAFVFSSLHGDDLQGVKLIRTDVPPVETTPIIVDTPLTSGPVGLRTGQSLIVKSGGVLQDNVAVIDATLSVEGGDAGTGVEVVDGVLKITGGAVGPGLAVVDSLVELSSGSIGERSAAYRGSVVNINGGVVGKKFNAFAGSEVAIAGGAIGPDFRTWTGSDVQLIGGDFRLNGEEYLGDTITLDDRGGPLEVFTGTLADGTPFVFSPEANPLGDELKEVKLIRVSLPPVDGTPQIVDSPVTRAPLGLGPGQRLTLMPGGELQENFTALGAELNIDGGKVGSFAEVVDSTVTMSGGEIGGWFQAHNSHVDIAGGTVGVQFAAFPGTFAKLTDASVGGIRVYSDSVLDILGGTVVEFSVQVLGGQANVADGTVKNGFSVGGGILEVSGGHVRGVSAGDASLVNLSGGMVESFVRLNGETLLNISDGKVNGSVTVSSGSIATLTGGEIAGEIRNGSGTVNIFGGSIIGDFSALTEESVTNIFGQLFILDGVPLSNLEIGEAFKITARDVVLSGLLADGTPFSFDLNAKSTPRADYFSREATLTVTLVAVPEPQSVIPIALSGWLILSVRHADEKKRPLSIPKKLFRTHKSEDLAVMA